MSKCTPANPSIYGFTRSAKSGGTKVSSSKIMTCWFVFSAFICIHNVICDVQIAIDRMSAG